MGLIKYLHRMGHTTKKHNVYIEKISFSCKCGDQFASFETIEIKFARGSARGTMESNSITALDDQTKVYHFLE